MSLIVKRSLGLFLCLFGAFSVINAQESCVSGTLKVFPWVEAPVVLSTDVQGGFQSLGSITLSGSPSVELNVAVPEYKRIDGMMVSVTNASGKTRYFEYSKGTTSWTEIYVAHNVDIGTISETGTISSTDLSVVSTSTSTTLGNVSLNIKDKAVADSKLDKTNIPLSGFGLPTANVAMGGTNTGTQYRIINLATPTATDINSTAATKKYVDDVVGSWSVNGKLYKGTVDDVAGFNSLNWATDISTATVLGTSIYMGTVCQMDQGKYNWIAFPKEWGTQYFFYRYGGEVYPVFDGFEVRMIPASETGSVDYQTILFKIKPDMAVELMISNDNQNLPVGLSSLQNGTSGSTVSFDAQGNVTFQKDVTVLGNLYTPSDERLKTNIHTLTDALDKIDRIRGVQFEYKDQKKYVAGPKVGVIAQELSLVYPFMVTRDDDGYLKVDYTQLTGMLIQAMKEQQQEIKKQQQEIDELKRRMDMLQGQVEAILLKQK